MVLWTKNDGIYYIGGAKDDVYHGYGLMTIEDDDVILLGMKRVI